MAGRFGDTDYVEFSNMSTNSTITDDASTSESSQGFSFDGLLKLRNEEEKFILLKHQFYMCIGMSLSKYCTVVAAYKNLHSSPMAKARLGAFRIFLKAMEEKNNGDLSVKSGWFGTRKDGVFRIINDGFDVWPMPEDQHGFGLCLCSGHSLIDSVLSSPADEEGLKYVVACRMILGSSTEGSRQSGTSSEDFKSGTNGQHDPTKYMIRYADVSVRVLPVYVLTIKLDFRSKGLRREPVARPVSPWMPLTALLAVLSKFLPPSAMLLIRRFHTDFIEQKITRRELILRFRGIAGDKILMSTLKAFQRKLEEGMKICKKCVAASFAIACIGSACTYVRKDFWRLLRHGSTNFGIVSFNLVFVDSRADVSLFIRRTSSHVLFLLIYVDDVIITGSSSVEITNVIKALSSSFALKDLGSLHFFLGIEAYRSIVGIFLSQHKYIHD